MKIHEKKKKKNVKKKKKKTIIVNGEEIPVSARLKSKIKKEYSQYCKENARFC